MFKKSATFTAIFIGIFAGLFLANSTLVKSTHAYELTVTTSGDTIIEPQNGQVVTKTSEITVKTDCRAGYTLQIQGPTDTNLYLDGDATKNETDKYIKPVNSTSALNAQPNTYGYNLASNQINQIFTPLISTATTLKTLTDTASPSADINEITNLHWGAYAGLTLNAGTYKLADNGAVKYIITTSPTCVNYTVNFNANGGNGIMTPQNISVGVPTRLKLNEFTNSGLAFLKWNTKPDGTGDDYTNNQQVTDLAPAEQSITLYAIWADCPANKICYSDNGANSPTKMSEQLVNSFSPNVMLWPSNFQRAEHGFLGWSEQKDGTGTIYGPMETIPVGDLSVKGITLYAIWQKSTDTLQNWQGCKTMRIGETIALTDNRDGDTYAVARLEDGNCWFMENLRLDDSAELTAENTNNPSLPLTNADNTTSNHLSPSSDDNWCKQERNPSCTDKSLINAFNTTETVRLMQNTDSNIYSYGNYYNWYSATAGTGKVEYTSGIYSEVNYDVAGSICPKGWEIMHDGGVNINSRHDFTDLLKLATGINPTIPTSGKAWDYEGNDGITVSNKIRSHPYNYVLSGIVFQTSTDNNLYFSSRGSNSFFWTSTTYMTGYVWYSSIKNNALAHYARPIRDGLVVRCLTLADKTYTFKFDANGGFGNAMSDQVIKTDETTNLSANTYTAPESWQSFLGWNTEPDGTGTSYTDSQSVTNALAVGETITLYAQWGCPPNKICYRDNGANSSTKMSEQSASANTKTDLWASNFQYSGYGFAGWSPDKDASAKLADPANALTSPVVYGPNETIVTPSNLAQKGLTLYAVWIKSAGDIQAWRGCDSLSFSQLTALTDTRDNQTYAVSKLADGTCWTIENLRLDSAATITAENTDNPVAGFTLPASSAPSTWCQADNKNCIDQTTLYSINTTNPVSSMNNKNNNVYSYGNYYNYASATAGHGRYGENLTINQPGSVCPAGWRLPTARTPGLHNDHPGSYTYLNQQLGGGVSSENNEVLSNAWRSYPNNLIYSGEVTNGNLSQLGDAAYYWSSTPSIPTAGISSSEYALATIANISASNFRVAPGMLSTKRYYGTALRCVVRDAYTVKFDANGGSGDMPDQTIYTDVATKLSANTFTPPNGKVFAGWNTASDGSGTAYANEASVTDLVATDQSITLYAQWTEPTPLEQISTMQEMTSDICSATPVGTEAILEDTRDGKTYSVTKLKDGNCWMTENLDHDIDATKTYTPADTDISSNWTPDVSTINIQGLNVGESVAGWVGAFGDNGLASADPGEVYWDDSTNRHSRIGNYYDWTAALAVNDSSAYSNGTETDPSQNPQTSICPKGWRLPIIANENLGYVDEFKELNRLYNNGLNSTDSGLIASPLYFARGGVVDQSSELQGVGDAGSYWSSTAGGPMYVFNTAYYFNHNAGYNDSYSSNIAFGHNIRCVARQSYTVSFDSNGGSGTMSEQTINANMPTKLITNSFTIPAGYFLGWNTKSNGSGTSIADNELVTNLANANENITLYAQWYRYTLADISTMQEMNSDICANTSMPEANATSVPEKQLRDTRDNKMYWVAKLADGKCWMTQNLDLNLDATKTYTPDDTDLTENWTPIRSTIDASNVTNRIVPGFEYITTSPYSVDPGDWYWKNDPFYASTNNLFLNNQAGDKFQKNTAYASNGAHGHVGNYYNWTAAIASNDSNEYSADATSDISKRPPNSICPKGWRLPMASNDSAASEGSTNEFGRLNYLYNNGATNTSQNLEAVPLYFVRAGYISNDGAQFSAGNSSIYNSSISRGDTNTYQGMTLRSTAINSNASIARSGAGSVRCVAR